MSVRFAIVSFLWLAAIPGLAQAQATHPVDSKAEKPLVAKKAEQPAMEDEAAVPYYNTVILQGLNKVTGHVSRLEGPLGITMRFGTLEIVPRRCWKTSPDERPENAALLEIRELQPGEDSKRIFLGWMFSSSPGLTGLEHPVYDINVLSCEYRVDPEKNDTAADKTAAAPAAPVAEQKKPVAKKPAVKHKKPVKQPDSPHPDVPAAAPLPH